MLTHHYRRSILIHTILYERTTIWKRFVESRDEKEVLKIEAQDVHRRLMKRYEEVPEWWYMIIFALMFALSIVVVTGELTPSAKLQGLIFT